MSEEFKRLDGLICELFNSFSMSLIDFFKEKSQLYNYVFLLAIYMHLLTCTIKLILMSHYFIHTYESLFTVLGLFT